MISMRGIRKSFDRLEVLRGVDLDVNAGEILSLIHIYEPTRPY